MNVKGVTLRPAPEGKRIVQEDSGLITLHASNAITHSTSRCIFSSGHPAPRRMTPRAASISQVVEMTWATYQKNHGIESSGKT